MARALAADPPVLLMDEPFSAVDPWCARGCRPNSCASRTSWARPSSSSTHDIDEAITLGTMVRRSLREAPARPVRAARRPADRTRRTASSRTSSAPTAASGGWSFFPSDALELTTDAVIPPDATAARIAAVEAPTSCHRRRRAARRSAGRARGC
ncbi:hypothetical protein GCM10023238_33970 [Streptomyces heliomycini]